MNRRPQQSLGVLLVQRGLITESQVQQALARQRVTGQFLGALMVEGGWITASQLLSTLSEQFDMPSRSLSVVEMNWQAAKLFPPTAFSDDTWFPIASDESTVTVAIANPLDAWNLSSIEQWVGLRTIRPVLVLDQELKAVCQAYRQHRLSVMTRRLDADGYSHR